MKAARAIAVLWKVSREQMVSRWHRLRLLAHGVYVGSGTRINGACRMQFGPGVIVQRLSVLNVSGTGALKIGANSRIGAGAIISAIHSVEIGENVLLADRVFIADHNHEFRDTARPVMTQGATSPKPVRIGAGSWLGVNSCILPGVELGEHCVVGANSVVTRSFPAYSIVGGVPARVIGSAQEKR